MARRLRVQRLILVLGVLVLGLGALSLWLVSRGVGFGLTPPSAEDRAVRQIGEQMGPSGELRYAEVGEGRALCGYAGRKGSSDAVAFVSRPNRILFSDDPLPVEFREMQQRFCPDFLVSPPTGQSPPA